MDPDPDHPGPEIQNKVQYTEKVAGETECDHTHCARDYRSVLVHAFRPPVDTTMQHKVMNP